MIGQRCIDPIAIVLRESQIPVVSTEHFGTLGKSVYGQTEKDPVHQQPLILTQSQTLHQAIIEDCPDFQHP